MEFICIEEADGGSWYFLPDLNQYIRIKVLGRLDGDKIINPHTFPREPTPATFKLWGHWNARQQIPD